MCSLCKKAQLSLDFFDSLTARPKALRFCYGSTAQLLRQALSNHPLDRKP